VSAIRVPAPELAGSTAIPGVNSLKPELAAWIGTRATAQPPAGSEWATTMSFAVQPGRNVHPFHAT
jgi:hypothetical protein